MSCEAGAHVLHLQLGAPAVLSTEEPDVPQLGGGRGDLGTNNCVPQQIPERKVWHCPFGHGVHPADSPGAAAESQCNE